MKNKTLIKIGAVAVVAYLGYRYYKSKQQTPAGSEESSGGGGGGGGMPVVGPTAVGTLFSVGSVETPVATPSKTNTATTSKVIPKMDLSTGTTVKTPVFTGGANPYSIGNGSQYSSSGVSTTTGTKAKSNTTSQNTTNTGFQIKTTLNFNGRVKGLMLEDIKV